MSERYSQRYLYILVFFAICTLVLLLKAMHLQLFDEKYQAKANSVAVDEVTTYPSRGLIYDRNGKLLVYNNALYDLMVQYNQLDPEMDTLRFCQLLRIDKKTFERNINKDWQSGRFSKRKPFVFLDKISARHFARIQESLYQFPGFFVRLRNIRGYPYPHAAHVLGYLGEVNRAQIENSNGIYALGDYVGASGLEAFYEKELRGEKGVRYILKDKFGREVESFGGGDSDIPAISGKNLISSLDIDLQIYCEKLMKNKRGSIVAIEPATGEVLTLVSAPFYDPNLLVIGSARGANFSKLRADTLKPFFDRSVMAKYPPGSIFKTVIGLVAMEEEITTSDHSIFCPGYYQPGSKARTYKCHGSHRVDMTRAIQYSCNSYFFQTFRDIVDQYGESIPQKGLSVFNDYLDKFGLGRQLEIDYPREGKGNNPRPEQYDKLYKNQGGWNSGKIMSVGIGQGEIEMTTLQMANLAAILGNRGKYILPHLAKGFQDGEAVIPLRFRKVNDVGVSPIHFTPIIEGMEKVVQAGTATAAYIPDISICGKTGTSQNRGEDHSVFFGFAPKDNPRIAIAVYIENGGFGGSFAAPIASLVIEKYTEREIRGKRRQQLEEKMLNADLINQTAP